MALNTLINPAFRDDFQHGLRMLIQLQDDRRVTQFLGFCRNSFLTEYQELRGTDHIEEVLTSRDYQQYNTIDTRFQLCIDYVNILSYLHDSPIGTRVMCDSNDLFKTLNQYLITSDLRLVVNDLDALPQVNHTAGQLIKCGHRAIFGDFPAPEQIWVLDEEFDDTKLPPYDEKTDIWKIPAVCDYLLGSVEGSDSLRFYLFNIHAKCLQADPMARPGATEVLQEYLRIQKEFGFIEK